MKEAEKAQRDRAELQLRIGQLDVEVRHAGEQLQVAQRGRANAQAAVTKLSRENAKLKVEVEAGAKETQRLRMESSVAVKLALEEEREGHALVGKRAAALQNQVRRPRCACRLPRPPRAELSLAEPGGRPGRCTT